MIDQTYGRRPENPILLNSISASRLYLNKLITSSGCHLVYHRLGSLPAKKNQRPIDHYEIMTAENWYDDLYINVYNETNTWVPPEGYLFSEEILSFPKGLTNYEMENINELDLNIDLQYILYDKPFEDLEHENEDDSENSSILELFLCRNFGENSKVANFPNPMIIEAIEPEGDPENEFFSMVLKSIKPRKS